METGLSIAIIYSNEWYAFDTLLERYVKAKLSKSLTLFNEQYKGGEGGKTHGIYNFHIFGKGLAEFKGLSLTYRALTYI